MLVALGGVIKHDVENQLDTGAVQRAHHSLELGDYGPLWTHGRCIALVGPQNPTVL